MNNIDIEILVNLKKELWNIRNYEDPNNSGEYISSGRLREPFRQDFLDLINNFKRTLNNSFDIVYGKTGDNLKIIINNIDFNESFELSGLLIKDLFNLTHKIKSISLYLYISKKDEFYSSFDTNLFLKYDGHIPLTELKESNFSNEEEEVLSFKNKLITNFKSKGVREIEIGTPPIFLELLNPNIS